MVSHTCVKLSCRGSPVCKNKNGASLLILLRRKRCVVVFSWYFICRKLMINLVRQSNVFC